MTHNTYNLCYNMRVPISFAIYNQQSSIVVNAIGITIFKYKIVFFENCSIAK